jgi:hypothetical protein
MNIGVELGEPRNAMRRKYQLLNLIMLIGDLSQMSYLHTQTTAVIKFRVILLTSGSGDLAQ